MMNELKKLDLLMGRYTLNTYVLRDDSINYLVNAKKLKRVYDRYKLIVDTITVPYNLMYCDIDEVEAILVNAENERLDHIRVK